MKCPYRKIIEKREHSQGYDGIKKITTKEDFMDCLEDKCMAWREFGPECKLIEKVRGM